jgi:excisionase family DNA binding protein
MISELRPGTIPDPDVEQLSDLLSTRLTTRSRNRKPQLVGRDGTSKDLPEPLYRLLLTVVDQLSRGNGVTIVPLNREMTTADAATILNVSRPHVVKLLDAGEIPFHKVGTHRRIALADVLAYKDKREGEFEAAMRDLHEISSEMGLPE